MVSLPERLVKCGTVQTFRRHLDRIDLSKFISITYQESACAACICCCIAYFCFLLWGEGISVFLGFPYPVANQLYCFCLLFCTLVCC